MREPFRVIKQMYSLSEEDVVALRNKFIPSTIFGSDLVLGQLFEQKPTMVVGTPCPRKCIEGISFNTAYQILMPLRVARELNLPCKIFLGIKEEVISQPYYARKFRLLGQQLERGIKRLAESMGVNVQVINTLNPKYDLLIDQCVREIPIELSNKDSSYLFSLSIKKQSRPLHSVQRVGAEKRSIACNTTRVLQQLFGKQSFLIVEDVEQYGCVVYAHQFSTNPLPNMLAFMPLPNIQGTTNMFKAQKNGRLLLMQKPEYYRRTLTTCPEWVKGTYTTVISPIESQSDLTDSIMDVSNYFK